MNPIRIPYDSNLHFLPLMYFLPEDMIMQCPTLRTLPRYFRVIIQSDKWRGVVESDQFLNEIINAGAAIIFPHFGFSGWKEHYTGYCPVYQLCYAAIRPVYGLLASEIGWGLQALQNLPSDYAIPFFEAEYIKNVMSFLVSQLIEQQSWQPILDAVRKMPCDEDFENWDTNVRKDFLRKWYHTRSKRVRTVSLEACMEDEEHGIHEVEDVSSSFEDRVVAEDFCQRFKARLSEKDMRILELRVEGFTYEAIADKLGYKNHSGVIKRIQSITKAFVKYEEEQQ